MTEETAITVPDDVRATFRAFDDDYLADVLRLWDCDLKRWRDPSLFVFRFENDDVLVWQTTGTVKCKEGAVDTTTTRCAFPESIETSIDPDACLCWLPDSSFSDFIGLTEISHDLLQAMRRQAL